VVVHLEGGRSLEAPLALGHGVGPVAAEGDRTTALDVEEHAAVLWAQRAERPPDVATEL
jgi:hypothetical protein